MLWTESHTLDIEVQDQVEWFWIHGSFAMQGKDSAEPAPDWKICNLGDFVLGKLVYHS